MSSIAPVLGDQLAPIVSVAIPTTMTGQRSRAEMKAKDVLSDVAYGATGISILDPMSAVASCPRNEPVVNCYEQNFFENCEGLS